MASFPCHHCGAPLDIDEPIPRDAECPRCMGDVRCCINCRHFDPRYNNSCRETEADPVEDKDRRNFCEFFAPSREPFTAGAGGAGAKQQQARAKLDALFGGPAGSKPAPTDARAKLDALFRKKPEDGE